MKKIYLLFTLLFITLASSAQTFSVSVQGKEVTDGETLTQNYETVPVTWIVPNVVGTWTIDPEIKITSDSKQEIKISASDNVNDGILQNCAFGNCVPVKDNNPAVAEGTIEKGEMEAAIHLSYGGTKPADDIQRDINIEVSNGSKTVAFTIKVNVGKYATSIKAVCPENTDSTVYTISGSKVNANDIPSGKIVIKNGKKIIK